MTNHAIAKAMVVFSFAIAAAALDPTAFLSGATSVAHAGGFFVSTAGDDDAVGSLADPWGTMEHAFEQLLPGDTLYVRGGTYYESPTLSVSGTESSPIVIRSYPGERGVLDSGTPLFRTPGNLDWELVDAARGEYRSVQALPSGDIYAYLDGIPDYENGRVALIPYESAVHFRSTTDQYGASFYVGPGTLRIGDRIHVRLSKTSDLRYTESKYGTVLAEENADPRNYSIGLSTDKKTLRITGAYLIFKDLTFNQGEETVQLRAPAHHVTFDGITAWRGNSVLEIEGAHHVEIVRSRIYGDCPYWIFWSDMKDFPAPANRLRGTSIDMSEGAHDIEIAYSHVRGSGNDLIATKNDEYDVVVHHNRIENAGDDAFEIEGTINVGRVEIFENYILNALTAIAPAQSTPSFNGPLLVYRNVIALLRPPPVNRAQDINSWNGGHRYGYNYMFKHGTDPEDVSRNTHYYHNTMVLLDSNERGLNIIPSDPTNCRITNNIAILVNGTVNHDIRTGPGFLLDGNLYWKINDLDDSPLVASHLTVDDFSSATGFEEHGIGNTPGQGTDPRLPAFELSIVDPSTETWQISAESEVFGITDFMPEANSPVIGAGVVIPAVPGLGTLPDSRNSLDVGAIPHGTDPSEFAMFPFDPNLSPSDEPPTSLVSVAVAEPAANASLRAWPVPMRGGVLDVRFAAIAESGELDLAIYDLAGRRVRTLASGAETGGIYRATWDGRDFRGASVATGIYLLKARQGAVLRSRKLIVVR